MLTHAGGSMWVRARSMRYAIHRSMKEKDRHLIFEEGSFKNLPENIRRQGPWQYLKSGEFEDLRVSEHRCIIVEQSAGIKPVSPRGGS